MDGRDDLIEKKGLWHGAEALFHEVAAQKSHPREGGDPRL
jgi:hypothetical protein